ncbi:acyltransferase family protein [Sphingomonas sp. KR3-1]|uniref:acyltransferase family protein n=1 Tax=Sphingomonas sp. KR3-1 TaxID=3156611 RepID=UPI0032B405CA
MTSAERTPNSFRTPTERARRHDLDALRAVFLLFGIPYHASLTARPGPWIANFHERSRDFIQLADYLHLFRMPGFYMIAGYFAAMLLQRRPVATYLPSRLHRLVPPFLAGTLLLVPAMHFLLLLEAGHPDPLGRWWEIMTWAERNPFEHLWFVQVLLYYTAGLAGLVWLFPALARAELGGERPGLVRGFVPITIAVGLLLGLLGLGSLQLERYRYLDNFAVNFLSARYALDYLPWFALGAVLQRIPALDRRFARFSWILFLTGLVASIAVVFGERLVPFLWRPVLTGVAAICLTQASLGALAHFIDGERRWVKALVSASFVIYLFHEPLIVLATPWLDLLPIPVWPKFILLCLVAFFGSYGIWKLIKLSPALRYLFNGERKKKRVER